jgi:hypothetical protein
VSAVQDKQNSEYVASRADDLVANMTDTDLVKDYADSANGSAVAVNAFGVPIETASADVFKAPFDFSDMQEDVPEMELAVHDEPTSIVDNIVEDEQPESESEEESKSSIYPIFET